LIEDIGTTFDVNAYPDEPVAKTTLVEGSVRVNQNIVLKPGQQSQLQNGEIKVLAVNTADIIAWRSNMFRFRDEPLQNIMRQAARWYDVDVAWENESLKNKPFGTISERFATANQFLHKLELTGEVKFKIEGRKITVMNKEN
jgi:ferric-dicitrate binding protein FerR (iron transport regulator)